jgi:hypothetical protein
MRVKTTIIGLMVALGMLTGGAPAARAADPPQPEGFGMDRTPPRLSFTDGQVSFFRPGAPDWAQAQVNMPLAPGDELATGSPGTLEIQIGARAFVRGWGTTQLGLSNQEPDFVQFKVTGGRVSFDLRTVEPGHTVEVDTPNAVFTIEHAGYYRVDVAGERTMFVTRRAGQASVTLANGVAAAITPSEEAVIDGTASPQLASYAAAPLDDWDRWNYARTDWLLDAVSARYVASGTYGVRDLDPYGSWRVVPTYGSVWVPTAVSTGWVPYSTGSWILDPVYGWTWVDAAPWGWAPFHYGRWVFVDSVWAWAPGPVVVRPIYTPALVAFFGEPTGASVGFGPVVGWVALGWGEPCVPWWGHARVPSWRGWGGPRVVNNVVVTNTTIVNVQNIAVYRNTTVANAVVAVDQAHFGHGPIAGARITTVDAQRLQPVHAAPPVAMTPASVAATASRALRPPDESLKRPVVATRPPNAGTAPEFTGATVGSAPVPRPAPHLVPVSVPPPHANAPVPPRPSFGQSRVERPMTDGVRPPSPPKPNPPAAMPPATPAVPPNRAQGAPVTPPAPGPQVATTAPATPAMPPGRAQGAPVTPPAPGPRVATTAPATPAMPPGRAQGAPVTPPAPGPRVATTAPATPPVPPGRAQGPAAASSPTRSLPGEPANHLAPHHGQGVPAHAEKPAG